MKIIIDGAIGEEDLILFARFLREMWRHKEDKLFVMIEKGTEDMLVEDAKELFKRIFTMNDKDWKENTVTKQMYDEFKERMRK